MTTRLLDDQIHEKIKFTNNWLYKNNALVRVYKFRNFPQAMTFVNDVAKLADSVNHHPDININFNTVTLTLSHLEAGGVTDKDFELIRLIDSVDGRSSVN